MWPVVFSSDEVCLMPPYNCNTLGRLDSLYTTHHEVKCDFILLISEQVSINRRKEGWKLKVKMAGLGRVVLSHQHTCW